MRWIRNIKKRLQGPHATQILRNIESAKGKTDPNLFKRAEEYAQDVLGWRGFAPWLKVYSAMAGEFKEGWIPETYYTFVVIPKLNRDYGKVSHLKPLTNRLFNTHVFPDIASYINGLWYTRNNDALAPEHMRDYLFQADDRVVFKRDASLQGKGVFVLTRETFNPRQIEKLGNGVFQSFIRQHPYFNTMMPSSVANVRITTVIDDMGKITARAGYLRLGRKNDTHVQSSTNLRIPFNPETGELDACGYLASWVPTSQHPDTGVSFAHRTLPLYDTCRDTVLRLHHELPYCRCIGWDVTVDDQNEVKIMEWNGNHPGIKFTEATQGPSFIGLGWENIRPIRKDNPNRKIRRG